MRKADTQSVTVVSLSYNSERFIRPFIQSLHKNSADLSDFELLLIDNGSKDNSIRATQTICQELGLENKVTVIPLGRNTGTTFSRNIGIRMAKFPFILICDSDIVFPIGSIKKLIDSFILESKREKIGILHPKLIYPNGEFQESARKFPSPLTKLARLLNKEDLRNALESIPSVLKQKKCNVDYAISATWLTHVDVIQKIGLLDENIFYAPEDVEYCHRLKKRGYYVKYNPEITITHDCQRLTRKKGNWGLKISHIKGLIYYWTRYWILR